jgi:hypothetical protein
VAKKVSTSEEFINQDSVFSEPDNSIFDSPLVYKLNMYTPSGHLRYEVTQSTAYEVGKLWGDLIRCISSTHWMTVDEICRVVAERERKSFRKSFVRTREEIEQGITFLTERNLLMIRVLDT